MLPLSYCSAVGTSAEIDFSVIKRTHFRCIDSTQTQAKNQIGALLPNEWLLYTADEQTAGRGQYNRKWASPPDVNVYATYVCTIPRSQSHLLFHMAQVATIAVAKTLEDFGFHPTIKWINDLMLDRKKMCGILCESETLVKNQDYLAVLCGIGVNVNMSQEICSSLDQPVTSLLVESGKAHDKEAVFQRLSFHLFEAVQQLIRSGFASFQEDLNKRLAFLGEKITIERSNPTEFIEGVFERVDESGQMILRKDDGNAVVLQTGRIVR